MIGPRRAALIGWPVDHARSPAIHAYWLRTLGIDGSYGRIPVSPEDLASFMRGFVDRGLIGCNVTIPHKEHVLSLLDTVDASAQAIGAVNTIWTENGRLCGTNTDVLGFMRDLAVSVPDWQSDHMTALVLGAGGAARAIVYGLLSAGVGRIVLCNRSAGNAESLARHLDPQGRRIDVVGWDQRQEHARKALLVINTTSLGLKGVGSLDIDFAGFDPKTTVADAVYVPLETEFLADARRHGLRTIDGLGMLLHQAVPGFRLWFGVEPSVTPELRQLIAADIARS